MPFCLGRIFFGRSEMTVGHIKEKSKNEASKVTIQASPKSFRGAQVSFPLFMTKLRYSKSLMYVQVTLEHKY